MFVRTQRGRGLAILPIAWTAMNRFAFTLFLIVSGTVHEFENQLDEKLRNGWTND